MAGNWHLWAGRWPQIDRTRQMLVCSGRNPPDAGVQRLPITYARIVPAPSGTVITEIGLGQGGSTNDDTRRRYP